MWTQGPCLWQWQDGEPVCLTVAGAYVPVEQWINQTHLYAWPLTTTINPYTPISGTDDFYLYSLDIDVYLETVPYSPPESDGWSYGGAWVSAPPSGTVQAVVFQASQGLIGGDPYDDPDLRLVRMEGEPCGESDCELWPSGGEELGVRRVCVGDEVYCNLVPSAEHIGSQFYPPTAGVDKYAGFRAGWNLEGYWGRAWDFYWIVEMEPGVEPLAPDPITPTESSRCVVSQTINLYSNVGASAAEIDKLDAPPLGLQPFVNGLWNWPTPLSEIVLRYEFTPKAIFRREKEPPYTTTTIYTWPTLEKHIVAWRQFDPDLPYIPPGLPGLPQGEDPGEGPLEVYECIEPERPGDEDCPRPKWHDLSGWIPWLWCNQRAWFAYADNTWRFYVCIIQATIARSINTLIFALINFYTNIAMQLYEIAYLVYSYYDAWAVWVYTNWQGFVYWLHDGRVWAMQYYAQNSEEIGRFTNMAVTESSDWAGVMLDWVANDVVQGGIDAAATIVGNAAGMASLLASEFSRAVNDFIDILLFVIRALTWLANLVNSLIEGVRYVMNDDLEADLFQSFAPAFWSGLTLFEDIIGDTPLDVLNSIALGLIFFGLGWWSIRQVYGMFNDLLKFG